MQNLVKLCALLLCTQLASGVLHAMSQRAAADVSLMRFMAATRDVQQNNPSLTLQCFGEFTPIFADNLDTYETEYRACLSTAADALAGIDKLYQDNRDQLEEASNNACELLGSCKALNASKDAFECYANAGSGNTMTMYNISANASVAYAEIVEQYRLVDVDMYRCTNISENNYAQRTADTYELLHLCLKGERAPQTPGTRPTTTTLATTQPPSTTLDAEGDPGSSSQSPPPEPTATTTLEPSSAALPMDEGKVLAGNVGRLSQDISKLLAGMRRQLQY